MESTHTHTPRNIDYIRAEKLLAVLRVLKFKSVRLFSQSFEIDYWVVSCCFLPLPHCMCLCCVDYREMNCSIGIALTLWLMNNAIQGVFNVNSSNTHRKKKVHAHRRIIILFFESLCGRLNSHRGLAMKEFPQAISIGQLY